MQTPPSSPATTWGAVLLALTLAAQTGCATHQAASSDGRRVEAAPRVEVAALGNIGIIATSTVPCFAARQPITKAAAAKAYGEKVFLYAAEPSSDIAYASPMPVHLFASAPAALVATVIGRAQGVSDEALSRALHSLQPAIEGLNRGDENSFQERLRHAVHRHATNLMGERAVLVARPVDNATRRASMYPDATYPGTLSGLRGRGAQLAHLNAQEIDTLLEITINKSALAGKESANPKLAVTAAGQARLIRVSDGVVLETIPFNYKGPAREYVAWGANSAAPFQQELDACFDKISAGLIARLEP